ncbi:protein FAM240B-like [Spea bombifrons]|uniref:protein FAM240B-like n=1 Tax=Spea bombifrons TaxID=233779 RepID=UPI002349BD2A|nr:protein FAM240B-like [Spea bombifrons]
MSSKNISGRREIMARDADGLKNFWEKKIEKQTAAHEYEDTRRSKSALSKLREEWRQRLESRVKMLQSLQEEQKKQLYPSTEDSIQHRPNTAA